MNQENQDLVGEYDRKRNEIPYATRVRILKELRSKLGLTSVSIASLLNVKPQTVRCWFSEENPRMISSDMIVELCALNGLNARADFHYLRGSE